MLQMEIYSGSKTVVREKVNKFLKSGVNVFSTHVTETEKQFTVTIFYSGPVNIKIEMGEPKQKEAMAQATMPLKADPVKEINKAINEIKIPELEIPIHEPMVDLSKIPVMSGSMSNKN